MAEEKKMGRDRGDGATREGLLLQIHADCPANKAKSQGARRRGKSAKTLRTEAAILEIVAERAPISVRGVAYALFVAGEIGDMSRAETNRVSVIMTAMRESGSLDWRLIADGTRPIERAATWSNPASIIDAAVNSYRRDRWQDQPALVEIWTEKSTVQGVLAPVLDEFGVTLRVMRGFGSHTALRLAAADSLDLPDGKRGIVFYLGDRDPAGMRMSEVDLPSRLTRYGARWEFRRIAVTEADGATLPHFDARTKAADPNYQWFVERYGRRCVELDAMDPNGLRQRVAEQIRASLDLPAWQRAQEIERVEVASMRDFHATWQQAQAGAGGAA